MMPPGPPVVPLQAPGLVGNTYHPPGESLPREVVDGIRVRPEAERTGPPAVGAVVGYRERPHGPVVAARVLEVESLSDPWAHERDAFEPHGPDVNVWRVITNEAGKPLYDPNRPGAYLFALKDDPWPSVVLVIEPEITRDEHGEQTGSKGARRFVVTREARRPGDAGYTPADQIGT